MSRREPSFTIGIEEEYLLVDRDSRDVVSDPPAAIFEDCARATDGSFVEHELLRSQIEVNTRVCETAGEAGQDLARLRRIVIDAAANHGLAPIAASTHPFGHWRLQHHTPKDRYEMLSRDMSSLAHRMLICGMHVHVGIGDDELRVELLNQFTHFLPLLLALSTSSPFWEGQETGLKSYRLTVFDNFPRTGLPEHLGSYAEYRRHVEILQQAGIIPDGSMIWWDLRISERYPTLEMRTTDICTRIGDAVAIAALAQCLLHWLYRLRRQQLCWKVYPRFLVDQNRWRAMRYGVDEGLIDFTEARIVPIQEILEGLLENLRPDADALGCSAELEGLMAIPRRGTSAHRQIQLYHEALASGVDSEHALRAVVDWLIEETAAGLQAGPFAADHAHTVQL